MAFMAAAVPFITGAAAVVGALSSIQQGRAARAAADYNAQIEMQNAGIARADAAAMAIQQDRENYLRLGSIRAAQGKAGGSASDGSFLDVLGDQAAQGELEKQQILYQGEQRARGYTNSATLDTFSGRNAERAGYLRAGTELLAGGANAAYQYNRLTRAK